MSEQPADQWLTDFDIELLNPAPHTMMVERLQQMKLIGSKTVAKIAAFALLISGGVEATRLAKDIHSERNNQSTACYVQRHETAFDPTCDSTALFWGELTAEGVSVLLFGGGLALGAEALRQTRKP